MKFKFLGLVAILAAICLICSCGGGNSSDSDNGQKTVALSLAVNTADGALRSITVVNPTVEGLTYQYMATALFSSEFGLPQGDTDGQWVDFTVTSGTGSIGELAQGKWEFEVRVIKELDNDFILMYQTAEPIESYINASITTVEVTVVRQLDDEGEGTLVIDGITAPSASGADKLVITYGAIGQNQSELITIDSAEVANGLSTFTEDEIPVAPGLYVMTFTVIDSEGNDVGASTKFVEIVKSMETVVSGNMDANKWVTTSFTIKGIKEITCETEIDTNEVEQGDDVEITITADITENGQSTGEDIKYYFCFNGSTEDVTDDVGEDGVYTWTADVAPGNYYINIIVTDETGTLATGADAALLLTVK